MARKHFTSEDEDAGQQRKRSRQDDPSQDLGHNEEDQESHSEYECDEAEDKALYEAAAEMAKRAPKAGAVRHAGAIEQLELFKFMCHDYLVIDFGPQANFIIGANGSGKSAVLAGITLGLGGKAATTDRASSLKGHIKHGATRAEIKLTMSNRGEDAFRPDIYGETIIIERIITVDGGGQYKLRSGRDKKIISAKKEELQAILDHFMIQVDNPLNVLNQNDSKTFLSASSSKDKYGLFIRGTQLQQLTNEYEEIQTNITTAKMLLDNKQSDLSTIHERAKSARSTLKIVEQATEHENRIGLLQRELAWAYVTEAEVEKAKAAGKVQEEEQLIPQCEEELNKTQVKLDELNGQMAALTAKMSEQNDEELDTKRTELKEILKNRHKDIKDITNELREQDSTAKKLRTQLTDQQRLIDAENEKASRNTDTTRREALNRREECENEYKAQEGRLAELRSEITSMKAQLVSVKTRATELKNEIERAQRDINSTQKDLEEARRAQNNRLSAFGRSAEAVSRDVDASHWNNKPLGPLGIHLQCKDPKWASVIDTILGHNLSAYLVDNIDDENRLRKILQKHRSWSSIIRSSYDLFDYSSGEPDPRYLTVLRMLTFDDEYVKRALINNAKIERTILVEHRREGDPIMCLPREERRNVDRCYTIDGFEVGGAGTGKMVTALNMKRGASRLSNDHTAYIAERTEEFRNKQESKQQLTVELSNANQEAELIANKIRRSETEQTAIKTTLRQLKHRKNQLDDEIAESTSSNLAALEAIRDDLKGELDLATTQFQELYRRQGELKNELRPVLEEKERIDVYFASKQEEEKALQNELLQLEASRSTLKNDLKHWQDSLAKHRGLLTESKNEFQVACEKVLTVTAQATEFCGSDQVIDTVKPTKKLISDIEKHTKALKSTEARFGKNLDDIRAECQDATIAYQKATTQYNELRAAIKILRHALQLRKNKWHQFRAHITVRAKMKFINHLSNRGYTGKLNFDHLHQRLEVQVDTNSEELKQAKMRDPKGLSGGERSFSTISLLLTLWDAVNCPIRCLDEFDVFMDLSHRKVATRMMIDSAKEANEVQYIFITPQDMSSTSFGPETRISRMGDPERERGTLGAGVR
ncbi:hypothetical protein CROQUDRAFT_104465 [Cronartium quercuum f. sp. fusiforme G11]|uniref:RecF/RecN/SMC N-terminal domain-containing protein n=1 Tax=Cronartium quercuum f. sp. fusiforme G11 TaxID=708437 RepID=A0A9P6NN19_9BASI|nr:hypothetical protein CROQUDRAFT_104465 [Cronartium quercuum f. sp. fusiforme G11]